MWLRTKGTLAEVAESDYAPVTEAANAQHERSCLPTRSALETAEYATVTEGATAQHELPVITDDGQGDDGDENPGII